MTEYHYQATAKYYPRGIFGEWNLTATYTDGTMTYNLSNDEKYFSSLDARLANYLSCKYNAQNVFSKGQTFSTKFSVTDKDGKILATPTVGYGVSKCSYDVTDDDWHKGGGNFATLVKTLLVEKYGMSETDFVCDLGTFDITTYMYQPRSVAGGGTTTLSQNQTPVTNPTPAPVQTKPVEEDVFGNTGLNIFGEGQDKGDY